jgi:hypothetical protein
MTALIYGLETIDLAMKVLIALYVKRQELK